MARIVGSVGTARVSGRPAGPVGGVSVTWVVEHASGRLMQQVQVDGKHNETGHFQEVLAGLDLKQAAGLSGGGQVTVVTFDALHKVGANLDWLILELGVHYAAAIKKNHPNTDRATKRLP